MFWVVAPGVLLSAWAFDLGTGSAMVPRWAVVQTVAALILALTLWRGTVSRAALWCLPFLAWAGFAVLWSGDWRFGLLDWLHLLALAVVAFGVAVSDHPARLHWAVIAALPGVLAALVVWPDIFGGHGNENFAAEYLCMAAAFAAFPPKGPRWARHGARIIALCAAGYALGVSHSNAPVAVLGASLVAAAIYARQHWLAVALALAALAAPVFHEEIRASVLARAELFINSGIMWWSAPFQGHGTGGFNAAYPLYQEAHRALLGDGTRVLENFTLYAGNVHNEPLQVLSEQGLIGLMLAGLALVPLFHGGRGESLTAARACLFVAGVLSLIGFPLRNPSTGFLAAVAFGLAVAPGAVTATKRVIALPVAAMAAGFMVVGVKHVRAEAHYALTANYIESSPLLALRANLAAHQIFPLERRYRHQLLLTMTNLLATRPSALTVEAADRAYEISMSAGPNPSVQLARLMYMFNSGRWRTEDVSGLVRQLETQAAFQPVVVRALREIKTKMAALRKDHP
ncbi:MAG: hypothetical protein RIB80_04635 [Rhodospirillales bacterium]